MLILNTFTADAVNRFFFFFDVAQNSSSLAVWNWLTKHIIYSIIKGLCSTGLIIQCGFIWQQDKGDCKNICYANESLPSHYAWFILLNPLF